MQWLKTTLNEIYGLFVDDVTFALAIVGWLVTVAVFSRFVHGAANWSALLLAAGLLGLLVESATRHARGRRDRN